MCLNEIYRPFIMPILLKDINVFTNCVKNVIFLKKQGWNTFKRKGKLKTGQNGWNDTRQKHKYAWKDNQTTRLILHTTKRRQTWYDTQEYDDALDLQHDMKTTRLIWHIVGRGYCYCLSTHSDALPIRRRGRQTVSFY